MTITFSQFVKDFNEYYQTNYRVLNIGSNTYLAAIEEIYDCDYMEIDFDNKTIEIFE